MSTLDHSQCKFLCSTYGNADAITNRITILPKALFRFYKNVDEIEVAKEGFPNSLSRATRQRD